MFVIIFLSIFICCSLNIPLLQSCNIEFTMIDQRRNTAEHSLLNVNKFFILLNSFSKMRKPKKKRLSTVFARQSEENLSTVTIPQLLFNEKKKR